MDKANKKLLIETTRQLINEKKFSALQSLIKEQNPEDLNDLLEALTNEQTGPVYRLLPKALAAKVFVDMSEDRRAFLINTFSDSELKAVLNELADDETADLIEEMPATVVKKILRAASPDMRKAVNELLQYPDGSAGSIMTMEFVRFQKDLTVGEALTRIRSGGVKKESLYTCYVTDDANRLIGIVTATDLLLAPPEQSIETVMERRVLSVNTLDDREPIGLMFGKYNLPALPVVDNEKRLVGIITVDDAIEAMQEAVDEDFSKLSAVTPGNTEYLKTPVVTLWRQRIPWLLLLMISAAFTGIIISKFEKALAVMPILTAFIPMLMDTGGNAGSQASVTVIRGISLEQVTSRDLFRVIWKECRVALLCGGVLSLAAFGKVMLIDRLMMHNRSVTVGVAWVVALSLFAVVLFSKAIGSTLPLLAKKIGLDPAVMAAPLITTLIDTLSLLIYFAFAALLLTFP